MKNIQIYKKTRSEIKTGDLFFTASNFLFSRFIRWITRSKVSHVGIFVWIEGRLFIAEAIEGKGVVLSLASVRIGQEKGKIFWGKLHDLPEKKIIKNRIFKNLGSEYDMKGAIHSLRRKNDDAEWFCSEFSVFVLGIKFPSSKRGDTPDDVARKCFYFSGIIR